MLWSTAALPQLIGQCCVGGSTAWGGCGECCACCWQPTLCNSLSVALHVLQFRLLASSVQTVLTVMAGLQPAVQRPHICASSAQRQGLVGDETSLMHAMYVYAWQVGSCNMACPK
jgi:hypothetical protein